MVFTPPMWKIILLMGAVSGWTTGSAYARDPLLAEDGTAQIGAWYFDIAHSGQVPLIRDTLARYGVKIRETGFGYSWTQDLALFTQSGTLLLQAPLPADLDVLVGLSMGIFDGDHSPTKFHPRDAERMKLPYREMKAAFALGGEVITGVLPDGETYSLIGKYVLERTVKSGISHDRAHDLIAADLGVLPENLIVLPTKHHLDLLLLALPSGKILLHSPTKARELIGNDLTHTVPSVSDESLDAIQTQLEATGKFQVVRVAGVFQERWEKSHFLQTRTNFFNAFSGIGPSGRRFMITNRASENLTWLEDYWRALIVRETDIAPEDIHFIGNYSGSAGIDCIGAAAPASTSR